MQNLKTKQESIKKIIARMDVKMSKYIRARDKHCVCCETTQNLECGHYFSRAKIWTRFNFVNCNAQCTLCNSGHNLDPIPYRQFLINKIGWEGLDALEAVSRSRVKITRQDLAEIESEIDRKMEELNV